METYIQTPTDDKIEGRKVFLSIIKEWYQMPKRMQPLQPPSVWITQESCYY